MVDLSPKDNVKGPMGDCMLSASDFGLNDEGNNKFKVTS